MDRVELYRQLLGVTAPWSVQRVDMDVHGLRVDVHLEHAPAARFACPQCGRECSVYDHAAWAARHRLMAVKNNTTPPAT